jgi:hypothetical protein
MLLLVAQVGALAHAYEHDPGSPQDRICSTCIAGQSVGSACVDSSPQVEFPAYKAPANIEQVSADASVHLPLARQRAPPTSL